MNVDNIYSMPSHSVNGFDSAVQWIQHYRHLPEVVFCVSDEDNQFPLVGVKVHKYEQYDHRRFYRLASVWFKGKPVMVVFNEGREGRDDYGRTVTDKTLFAEMVGYIYSSSNLGYLDDEIIDEKSIIM